MNHTIVAMVGERIARVECNTCHSIHNYHPLKTAKEPFAAKAALKKTAAPRKARTDPDAADREEWAALEPGMDPKQAVPYDMNRVYRVDTLLLHPQFGLGIVKALLPPRKVAVLFRDAKKVLRCG
jgi:hypothetical protein